MTDSKMQRSKHLWKETLPCQVGFQLVSPTANANLLLRNHQQEPVPLLRGHLVAQGSTVQSELINGFPQEIIWSICFEVDARLESLWMTPADKHPLDHRHLLLESYVSHMCQPYSKPSSSCWKPWGFDRHHRLKATASSGTSWDPQAGHPGSRHHRYLDHLEIDQCPGKSPQHTGLSLINW